MRGQRRRGRRMGNVNFMPQLRFATRAQTSQDCSHLLSRPCSLVPTESTQVCVELKTSRNSSCSTRGRIPQRSPMRFLFFLLTWGVGCNGFSPLVPGTIQPGLRTQICGVGGVYFPLQVCISIRFWSVTAGFFCH